MAPYTFLESNRIQHQRLINIPTARIRYILIHDLNFNKFESAIQGEDLLVLEKLRGDMAEWSKALESGFHLDSV